ncbi:ectonucleoside triphosphate diphosphohydrolase 2 isoform X1 [Procambarus clarkii]|uniref:ectonucleoside triphosphate diphosphohydrolase 2 isoform X1 n=1 Tax=Procambarus clarkii TaxID=6728 RepID=UPI001E6725E3|nr:ectonucleoside triphosphate diphosphohydrolase 2-like isoform X1 [Procambarus clarkii]
MKVTVWSVVSGAISGHLVVNIPAACTVRKVLDTYCSYKGVPADNRYVIRSRDNLVLNPNKTLKQANIQDGETLTIGLPEDEAQIFSFGSWWMVMLAAFIIGIAGLVITFWLFLEPVTGIKKFGIVVDAGSSHSEVYVFRWNGQMPLGTADVELLHRCFISGGVNSFATHAEDIGRYFKYCIAEAETRVPKAHRPHTPLYVQATAGMRILKKFDPEGAQAILSTIREFFDANTSFRVENNSVEILPGTEEGLNGWIIVNYLNNHLKQPDKASAAVLDVGGVSLQLTSELAHSGNWTTTELKLFNQSHKVHSQSFLCYGIAQARHRYDFLLINKTGINVQQAATIDPCMAKGTTHQVLASDMSGPCTLTDNSKPLLSSITNVNYKKLKTIFKNYKSEQNVPRSEEVAVVTDSEDTKMSSSFTVKGSSNASMCEEKTSWLFDHQLCKKIFTFGDCLNAQSVPQFNHSIIAFSGLFDHLMLLLDVGANITLHQFKQKVYSVCSLEVEALYAAYPGLEKEVVEDLCFDAMFVFNLLTIGLGINNSTWANINFTDEVNKREVAWSQGFMLYRTSSFASDTPGRLLTLTTFSLLVLLFLAFVSSGILFLQHLIKIKRHSASYQRVIADHIDQELHRFI